MKTLPYSDIFDDLLVSIHKAIGYCHIKYKKKEILDEKDTYLSEIFEKSLPLIKYRTSGLDAHIIDGLTLNLRKRKARNHFPRISKIIIQAYLEAQKKNVTTKTELIPSPLYILYHILIVPSEPQTSAYSFVLCRSMLFYYLKLHTIHPELDKISPNLSGFQEEDILRSISSFRNYINIQARWPGNSNLNTFEARINYLCGHILSIKGYTYLWFGNDEDLDDFCTVTKQDLKEYYSNKSKYTFRLSGIFSELPDASEMNNWIFGVPIPIRGADMLFYGGLKKTSTTGLVINIHGQPGTGKTSTALSLAATMAPFNTKTVYISLEENPTDLKTRLNSLIPDYLRNMSIFENNYDNIKKGRVKNHEIQWFSALKFSEDLKINELTDILVELKSRVDNEINKNIVDNASAVPATCPLILVIDNINELFEKELLYQDIEIFINQCREMGAFVILLGADDIPNKFRLDYLVDVAIHLKQEGINSRFEKPIRILQLLKTRHQISRQGSHVFHLSNSKGFRISPQIPSQMDKREKVKIEMPSRSEFIHTLNLKFNNNIFNYSDFLPIATNSQIMIHGHGSSGKAGFGLKLLLTPVFSNEVLTNTNLQKTGGKINIDNQKKNKVLIISFLYPEEYYNGLEERVEKQMAKGFNNYDRKKSTIKVKAFYPGYLTPEDFMYNIITMLEEARLEGDQYTGVLLDGLHNVFLQFKNLQESHMIWPLLYSLLNRYSVTVVTTFTNISLQDKIYGENNDYSQMPQDFPIFQEAQKPFLHGLVKKMDYFFMLEEHKTSESKEYLLSVRSSIRQIPPNEVLIWDREKLTIRNR